MSAALSTEQVSVVLSGATFTAIVMWFMSDLGGVSRLTSAVITGIIAAVVMAVALWVMGTDIGSGDS